MMLKRLDNNQKARRPEPES